MYLWTVGVIVTLKSNITLDPILKGEGFSISQCIAG